MGEDPPMQTDHGPLNGGGGEATSRGERWPIGSNEGQDDVELDPDPATHAKPEDRNRQDHCIVFFTKISRAIYVLSAPPH